MEVFAPTWTLRRLRCLLCGLPWHTQQTTTHGDEGGHDRFAPTTSYPALSNPLPPSRESAAQEMHHIRARRGAVGSGNEKATSRRLSVTREQLAADMPPELQGLADPLVASEEHQPGRGSSPGQPATVTPGTSDADSPHSHGHDEKKCSSGRPLRLAAWYRGLAEAGKKRNEGLSQLLADFGDDAPVAGLNGLPQVCNSFPFLLHQHRKLARIARRRRCAHKFLPR